MHAILASLGTAGDILPYIGLGRELRSRGHRVTLVVNESFGPLAVSLGLEFQPLVTNDEMHALLSHPEFWHPLKSARIAANWGRPMIRRQYETLAGLAAEPGARLVCNPGVLAGRLVQEKLGTPLASVVLQPGVIPSIIAPPVMPGGVTLPRWAPKPLGHLYWRLLDAFGDWLLGAEVHALQASLGLPRMKRLFRWWFSPQLAIGMFPAWYGPPQQDWPPQFRLVGFPLYDGAEANNLSPELIDYCRSGVSPLAFTFGTGMMHAADLFRAAVEACRLLGRRGLLLTRHPEQLPLPLPKHMRHVEFAPFQQLFPLCSAVVHHGGVGTTARAMAAGVPQLIIPFAFDQEDNGVRIKQLGIGDSLPGKRRTAIEIAKALGKLFSPGVTENCREVAKRFEDNNAFQQAAEWIERL